MSARPEHVNEWRLVMVEYIDENGEVTYEHLGPFRGAATASRVAGELRETWAAIEPHNDFQVHVHVRLFMPLPDVLGELRRCANEFAADAPH